MTQRDRLLVLLDGHALVHRAFHALPPLTVAKTGEMVGAVYGFAITLMKVLNDLKPSHCAIAFDRPTPTFRHEQYEEYKAHRPPAPEELKEQFGRVREMVEAFHIPIFEVDGYEADDVLGTLSRQAQEQGLDVIIVTGDADAMQLVTPHVRVLTPRSKGMGDTTLYDEEEVLHKYAIGPAFIPDLKGLEGDTSDNIPGVPGVGRKTAVRLIQDFGSVEDIYAHIDEVAPARLQEVLRQGREAAFQSKELATIVTRVPIEIHLEDCAVAGYDRALVVDLFRELEFNRLLPQVPPSGGEGAEAAVSPPVPPRGEYRVVNTPEALDDLLGRLSAAPALVIDLETTGKDPKQAELVGISLSPAPGEAYYIPVGHRLLEAGPQLPLAQVLELLEPLLRDPGLPKIAQNGKYDMMVLSRYGVELRPLSFDTMIAAHILGEKAVGLKALAFGRLGIEMTPISALIGSGAKGITMAQVGVAEAAEYACADADMTFRLKEVLEPELRDQGLWKLFEDVEMPLVPVLLQMERNGVALDSALLREMSQSQGKEIDRLEAEIYASVGHQFNINSSQQLGAILYEELGLPHGRRTKGGYSTEASELERLKDLHEVAGLVLEYRQFMKLKSTYLDALPALVNPRTGRVHTTFNQTGTATGRLSSSDPNLQNIPVRGDWGKRIRQAFVAPPGTLLLAGDYSQIDLRVLAHFSQDPHLLQAFHRDEDVHAATASEVFGVAPDRVTVDMRRVAKTINFGVIYGMSEYGLEQATGLSREEAARFIAAYFEKYSRTAEYLEATKQKARDQGYVETILGRRRYIPEINASNRQVREAAERMAINMPVQGTSADIIKVAMIPLHRELESRGLGSRLVLQVHDELIFEVPQGEEAEMTRLVREIMSRSLELRVPLQVETKVGPNWGEME
ncbi:MAG: DNA polymerase I [Dehalococcoidia bacterium]